MKTRLLKKLRKEARLSYWVKKVGNHNFSLMHYKGGGINEVLIIYKDLDEAKARCDSIRRDFILERVNSMKYASGDYNMIY